MIKLGTGLLTMVMGLLLGVTVAFGQTATPTATPTPTGSSVTNTPTPTSTTPTPTGAVLPAQAPSTGFGSN